MVTRLQVTYRSPEIDEELDKKILQFFNTLDFICIDRNYHSIILRRDIFFEKQSEIDATADRKARIDSLFNTSEGEEITDGSKTNKKVELKA